MVSIFYNTYIFRVELSLDTNLCIMPGNFPLQKVLENPNPWTFVSNFWSDTAYNLIALGKAYWVILKDTLSGSITAIHNISPECMTETYDGNGNLTSYSVEGKKGSSICVCTPDDVISMKLLSYENLTHKEISEIDIPIAFIDVLSSQYREAVKYCKDGIEKAKNYRNQPKELTFVEKCKLEITKLKPTPGELLVLRFDNTTVTQEELDSLIGYVEATFENVDLIWMPLEADLSCFNEDKMLEHGWVKKRDTRREFF